MGRHTTLAAIGLALTLSLTASAEDELNPAKVGKIEYEKQRELEKIDKEYGNRKPSEMSQAERAEMMEKQTAASQKVLEANGVADKDYARYTSRMGADDRAAAKDATKAAERADVKKEVREELEKEKKDEPEVVPYEGADPAQKSPARSGGRPASGGKRGRGR